MEKDAKRFGLAKFGIFICFLGFLLLMWTMDHSSNNIQNYLTAGLVFEEPVYYVLLAIGGFLIMNGIFTIFTNYQGDINNKDRKGEPETSERKAEDGPSCPICYTNDTYIDYHGNLFCRKCLRITLEKQTIPGSVEELKALRDKLIQEKNELVNQIATEGIAGI